MEPRPPDRAPGRVIFLNGASSSGKSTLAKAVQQALPEPFLHVSSDLLVASGMLPARRDPDGPFAWWAQMRPRFFAGFHRCLPALAAAGNDLIVEHIIEFPSWRTDLVQLLEGLDVFLIGVHCDLAEIDRRERACGDRRIGEGRTHVETDLIHTFGPYDLDIDTTGGVTPALTEHVLAAWRARGPHRALQFSTPASRTTNTRYPSPAGLTQHADVHQRRDPVSGDRSFPLRVARGRLPFLGKAEMLLSDGERFQGCQDSEPAIPASAWRGGPRYQSIPIRLDSVGTPEMREVGRKRQLRDLALEAAPFAAIGIDADGNVAVINGQMRKRNSSRPTRNWRPPTKSSSPATKSSRPDATIEA
jgi:chloramphenicol 3-O phosphotransferase